MSFIFTDINIFYSCCVMFDVIAFRTQIIYEKHSQKMVGYVDRGTGKDEEVGKEGLVVMAVGFKRKWKALAACQPKAIAF
ncbi:hypothetical protein SNE40_005024 [Patella caerulea]|uniref:Transposable element P transposase-like RNase H domain-containing protein n=1 Tax=Patella caerulea TaxID=87958 RepID=A0AAN8KB29_PATCE